MSDIFGDLVNILSYCFEGFCAVSLFSAFIKPKTTKRYAKYLVGIVWIICTSALYLAFGNNSQTVLLAKLGINLVAMSAFSLIFYGGSRLRRIFPAVLFISIRELSVHTINCLLGVNEFFMDRLGELYLNGNISLETFETWSKLSVYVSIFVIEAARCALIYFFIKQIIKINRFGIRSDKEALIYLLPSAVGIFLSSMLRIMMFTVGMDGIQTIYQSYPALYAVIPAISVTLLCLITFSFMLYQKMIALQNSQTEKLILESQLTQMQNSLDETERLYDSVRSARHDMNNNMSVLRNLIAKKLPEDDEIGRYFEDMQLSIKQLDSRVKTGNAVCDTVISGKWGLAEKRIPNIKLYADEFICGESGIKSFDIGIILNNALDNAIEACERLYEKSPQADTYIILRSFKKRNLLFIEVENSFDGILKPNSENGLFFSMKDNSDLHGIGLRNIKNCADKYSGGVDFTVEDNRFILSVMLKSV